MKASTVFLLLLLPFLMSSLCKRDYYTGTEVVEIKLHVDKPAESIRLGDTLTFTLTIPPKVTSASGVENMVGSVQKCRYGITLNQLDTLNPNAHKIISPTVIHALKGSLEQSLTSINTTTVPPFESVLAIVPPARGVYYLQLDGGGEFKVNNSYEAKMRVVFDAPDKHWTLLDHYIPGFATYPGTALSDTMGIGFYGFRVK